MLNSIQFPQTEYEVAFSIAYGNDFQIHLKGSPNSCFIDNCFAELLLAWKGNFDIYTVFNQYKIVAYM